MIGIDLFAGAGGMSLGARLAGIHVALAIEIDTHAGKTYAKNHHGTKLLNASVTTLTRKALRPWTEKHDDLVIFGGPPCQGFSWSNARTRSASNRANWLFTEFLRIVEIVRPRWVVFENVQGIVDTAQGIFVRQLEDSFVRIGYATNSAKLNASHYGVPQNRTRYFLVASRDQLRFKFPKPSKSRPTVDDALRDLPLLANGHSNCWMEYGATRPSKYARPLRSGATGSCNHLVTRNASFVVERYKHVPQGGNWKSIPARLMKNYADRMRCHTGIYHRLTPNKPSIVIGNFRKNMLIHPTENRGLSVREAARIQSFPDSYVFCGTIGFQQQQVGNAVPPLLAKAVFSQIVGS